MTIDERHLTPATAQIHAARLELLDAKDRLACLLVGLDRVLGGEFATPWEALASAFVDPQSSGRLEVGRTASGAIAAQWLRDQVAIGFNDARTLADQVEQQLAATLALVHTQETSHA